MLSVICPLKESIAIGHKGSCGVSEVVYKARFLMLTLAANNIGRLRDSKTLSEIWPRLRTCLPPPTVRRGAIEMANVWTRWS
jgi:hypothetical protein